MCKMHAWPQALVESLLSEYPNILVLRVRMPIVGDLTYPRNFITKIIKYEKVRELHPVHRTCHRRQDSTRTVLHRAVHHAAVTNMRTLCKLACGEGHTFYCRSSTSPTP